MAASPAHHSVDGGRPAQVPARRSVEKDGKGKLDFFSLGPSRAARKQLSQSPPRSGGGSLDDLMVQVLKRGWLHKLSKGILKSWKRRWFVLVDNCTLHYFVSQDTWLQGDKPRATIDLTDCSIATAQKHTGRPNTFGLFHPDPKRSDLYLQASSELDMVEWIHTIETDCLGIEDRAGIQDFELLALVGRGAFGKVIQVKKKDSGQIYALKVLNKKDVISTNQLRSTQTERRVLEVVNHPFVVKLHYAFQTNDKLCFVLDFINGGDIFSLIKRQQRFQEDRVAFYGAQITMALEYLHEMDIVYRDLKPENVLLDMDGFIKLTDFGLSKDTVSEQRTYTIVGSPYYIAPEIVLKKGHGKAVDWWSLGILLYEMAVGLPPFYSTNFHMSYRKLLENPLEFPDGLSADCRDVLTGLLKTDPAARLGNATSQGDNIAADIRAHPFFASIDWDALLNKQVVPQYKPKIKDNRDVSHFELAAIREGVLLSSDHEQHLHFEDFDYAAPGPSLSPGAAPRASPPSSPATSPNTFRGRGRRSEEKQCPVMVAATEYLDECDWDYTRAVQGLISAILNREEVQLVLAPESQADSARAKFLMHPNVHALAQACVHGFKQFETHEAEMTQQVTHDWGAPPPGLRHTS